MKPVHSVEDLSPLASKSQTAPAASGSGSPNLAVPQAPQPQRSASESSAHGHPVKDDASSTTSSGSPALPRSHSAPPAVVETSADPSPWTCDGCTNIIRSSQSRVHCTECYDYDLCENCYAAKRETKDHKSTHEIHHFITTHVLLAQDLIPPKDIVNPEHTTGWTTPNWTVEGDMRWLHLHRGNVKGHARYLATSIPPGHYVMTLIIFVKFSPRLTAAQLEDLRKDGVCGLRVAAGFLHSKQQFFNQRYLEDGTLVQKLFSDSCQNDYVVDPSHEVIRVEFDELYHTECNDQTDSDMGFLLQWNDTLCWDTEDDQVVSIMLAEVR